MMTRRHRASTVAEILISTVLSTVFSNVVFAVAANDASARTPAGKRTANQEAGSGQPIRQGLAEVNGTRLFFRRIGTGDPLLVVHGGPVLEHGYLLPHLAPLAEDYELILADQRLSGRSSGTVEAESVRLAKFVDDIEQLRRELGLGRVHLLAHSWGGLLATHYALSYPESLSSLILVSPMAASSDLWQQEQQALMQGLDPAISEALREIRESEAFAEQRPEAIERMLLLSFETQFHDPARISDLDLYVPDDYMERSRQFGAMMIDLTSYDLHPRLDEISTPTLILFGADEPGVTLGGAALHEGISGSHFVAIESAGHFSFIERPDAFLRATREFLSSVTREPSPAAPNRGPAS
jgi:proline iminopeptidase